MADELERIKSLVDEEHALRQQGTPDPARLQHIEEQLDQCWDLLRQRDARREYNQSPELAKARDVPTVEKYLQ
jgi:hypothetical protein